MNYLSLNDIRQYLGSITKSAAGDRLYFNDIKFNGFMITFFAGKSAYCDPPVIYDNLLYYKTLQIDIVETIKDSTHVVCPLKDERFASFTWAKYFNYSSNTNILTPSHMGSHIPLDEVFQLIRDVYKVSRLKAFF
jgi:hypothetical protein